MGATGQMSTKVWRHSVYNYHRASTDEIFYIRAVVEWIGHTERECFPYVF